MIEFQKLAAVSLPQCMFGKPLKASEKFSRLNCTSDGCIRQLNIDLSVMQLAVSDEALRRPCLRIWRKKESRDRGWEEGREAQANIVRNSKRGDQEVHTLRQRPCL